MNRLGDVTHEMVEDFGLLWRVLREWVQRGVHFLRQSLMDRALYLLIFVALCVFTLAYQVRIPYVFDVGGLNDRPYWVSIHGREFDKVDELSFRWTTGNSTFTFPGWGYDNPVRIGLRILGGRPTDTPLPRVSVFVNGQEDVTFIAKNSWNTYDCIVDPMDAWPGDLIIQLRSDTFKPENDPRSLGVVVDWIRFDPVMRGTDGQWQPVVGIAPTNVIFPAPNVLLALTLAIIFLYLFALALGMPRRWSTLVGIATITTLGLLLAFARPYITIFALQLAIVVFVIGVFTMIAKGLAERAYRHTGLEVQPTELMALALLFAFALGVKFCGSVYPQTISSDITYHIHRLEYVAQGRLFWSNPSDLFGNQLGPYAPTPYLVLLPLARLFPDWGVLIKLAMSTLDVSTIFLLFFLARRMSTNGTPGLFAGYLYAVMPMTFIAFSWGVFPNIFVQWLIVVWLTALVVNYNRLCKPGTLASITGLLALIFFSHAPSLFSIAILLAILCPLWLIMDMREHRIRRPLLFIACIIVAGLIALVLYYGTYLQLIIEGLTTIHQNLTSGANKQVVSLSPVDWIALAQPDRTPFTAVPLYVYVSALIGLILLARRVPQFFDLSMEHTRLWWLLLLWFAATVILAVMRGLIGFSTRYVIFVLPVICLSTGALLAFVYDKGWIGKLLALAFCALLTVQGLWLWYVLMMFYYHNIPSLSW